MPEKISSHFILTHMHAKDEQREGGEGDAGSNGAWAQSGFMR